MKSIAGVFALLISTASVLAQPLADKVPADAMVYLRWSGTDGLPASYDSSHLKAVLDNSKLRELFTEFLPLAEQKLIANEPGAREPIAIVHSLFTQVWRHPTVFYFAGMDFSNPRNPLPKLALVTDAGAEADSLFAQLTSLVANAGIAPLRAFRQGNLVLVCVGYEQAQDALAGGLSKYSPFVAAMQQVQANGVFTAYLDVEKLLALIESAAAGDAQASVMVPKVIDALGLRGLKRFVCTSGFDGQDWISQSFVEAPAPRTGLMQVFDPKPVSPDLLKAIPADSTFVAAGRFDAAKLITNVRTAATQIGPDALRGIDMILGGLQLALGQNVVTNILEPLGEDWAVYCSPSVSGNGILGMVIVNRLDDPAKAQSALPIAWVNLSNWTTVALMRAGAPVQVTGRMTEIGGQPIYYVGAPIIAPAWSIKDGYLYMGLYPQPVASGARWLAKGAKPIATNEKVVALQKRLGVTNPCSFSFYDLQTTAAQGSVYQQLMMLSRYLGFADLFGMPVPEPLIPPLDVLQQHLGPSGSFAWVDDAGYHTKSISPFPGARLFSEPGMLSGAAPASVALGTSILLPSLNRARETANRVKCAANMKSIAMALLMDANEHRGRFPAKLGDLLKTQDITVASFVCPSGDTTVPPDLMGANADAKAAWVEANGDYVYLGGGKTASIGAEAILVYEKPGHHGNDGINILFGDGHVEFMMMNAAVQLIDQQTPGGQR